MKHGAAYIRVSDERQDEYSPDSQLKLIREYCRSNQIFLDDSMIFYDDGISAKNAEGRREFQKMIDIAKSTSHPIDLIVVWKFSRFARNQEESIIYKSMLKRLNIEVVSVSEPLRGDPFGSLVERIIEWMDEYYLVRLSGEVKRGMKEKALRGQPNAAPPFGYRMVDGKITANDKEADAVKFIFASYVSGKCINDIAKELNSKQIRTAAGNTFEPRAVSYILHNPIYAGYTRWSENGRMASKRRFDSASFIVARGEHMPIIDDDTFASAISRLERERKRHGEKSMLSSLLVCSACGARLTYQNSKTPSYQCSAYAKGNCKISHSISVKQMNGAVISALPNDLADLTVNLPCDSRREFCTLRYLLSSDLISEGCKNRILTVIIEKIVFNRPENRADIYLNA